jgi:hypothetical protein
VWGIDRKARLFLIDEWVAACTMDIWVSQLVTWAQIHNPIKGVSEAGVIRRASEPYLKREMRERGKFFIVEYMTRGANKQAMARPLQAMHASGQIYLPNTSVGHNTMDEFLRFPAAKRDNRVDAAANLCLYLEDMWAAAPPTPPKEEPGVVVIEHTVKDFMPERHPKKSRKWKKR